jgi:hypothetical protein
MNEFPVKNPKHFNSKPRFVVPVVDSRGANVNSVWRIKLYPRVSFWSDLRAILNFAPCPYG